MPLFVRMIVCDRPDGHEDVLDELYTVDVKLVQDDYGTMLEEGSLEEAMAQVEDYLAPEDD